MGLGRWWKMCPRRDRQHNGDTCRRNRQLVDNWEHLKQVTSTSLGVASVDVGGSQRSKSAREKNGRAPKTTPDACFAFIRIDHSIDPASASTNFDCYRCGCCLDSLDGGAIRKQSKASRHLTVQIGCLCSFREGVIE